MEYLQKEEIPYFLTCSQLIQSFGVHLVSLSVSMHKQSRQVRAVIYRKEGIGIDECATVHRALLVRMQALLQDDDIHMEVSSPGVGRLLKSSVEFEAFIGEQISVWDSTITDWRAGVLKAIDEKGITLSCNDSDYPIEWSCIKKARLNKI